MNGHEAPAVQRQGHIDRLFRYNDADSFRVHLSGPNTRAEQGGRLHLRLYHLETPETRWHAGGGSAPAWYAQRVAEQLRAFNLPQNRAGLEHLFEWGDKAQAVTLALDNLTITTQCEPAPAQHSARHYGCVKAPGIGDLGLFLVEEGLARVRTDAGRSPGPPHPCRPDGPDYIRELQHGEKTARTLGRGIWDTGTER